MKTARRLAVLAPLAFALLAVPPGCKGEEAGEPPVETPNQDPAAGGTSSDGTAPAGGAPKDAAWTMPAEPSRFAPDGAVSDADLAKYHVTLACSIDGEPVGTMAFDMWTEAAPITTRNFMRLCDEGFYDGLTIHRVLRDFMVQGGDPTGTGMGNSPYGTIEGEMADDPERAHGYGVLSMARSGNDMDSASCQFFLCCDESPAVWNLDGGYSSFGRLTAGVATLEAIAEVPVRALTSREVSSPMKRIVIEDAEVVEGPAPTGETIARPAPEIDLGGEPERVVIQHILLTCQGSVIQGATRTVAEAEALANELLAALREGADMDALVREHSDDNVIEGDETPGQMTILNNNVRDSALERESYRLFREFDSFRKEHVARLRSGEIDEKTYAEEGAARKREYLLALDAVSAMQRGKTSVAFGNVAFSLDVGEFGLAAFDPQQSQFGFHVVRRVE